MGGCKTVNGAYRYRYAPFFVPTHSALAPPLGELSTKVTERAFRTHFPSPSSLRHLSQRERGKGCLGGIEMHPICLRRYFSF